MLRARATAALSTLALLAACGPRDPCAGHAAQLVVRAARPYVGRWAVVRGDTVTLPEMGDRFTLREINLDSVRVRVATLCRFRGALVFRAPHEETLAVTWTKAPEQALVYGWPVDLGPFGGLGAKVVGDTLRAALLFDSRAGINVTAGVTAQFTAARAAPPRH